MSEYPPPKDIITEENTNNDAKKLDMENQYRNLLIIEIKQRIWIKIFSIAMTTIVIILMSSFSVHIVHSYFVGPFVFISSPLAIALFVTPTASITTITIMLLIGAFRRFKDDDLEKVNIPSLASEALKNSQGS